MTAVECRNAEISVSRNFNQFNLQEFSGHTILQPEAAPLLAFFLLQLEE
jgi:hypothetical protein